MRQTTKEWYYFEDLEKPHKPYITVSIGVVEVDPSKIIGLSLWTPEKVYNDHKMDNLIERIEVEGWNIDRSPQDIDLMRFPDGNYSVTEGGNHRSLLARERGMETIKARVDVLIPEIEINSAVFDFQKKKSEKMKQLMKEFRRVQKVLDENGRRAEELPEWEEYDRLSEAMDALQEQEDEMLREEARRLGYL